MVFKFLVFVQKNRDSVFDFRVLSVIFKNLDINCSFSSCYSLSWIPLRPRTPVFLLNVENDIVSGSSYQINADFWTVMHMENDGRQTTWLKCISKTNIELSTYLKYESLDCMELPSMCLWYSTRQWFWQVMWLKCIIRWWINTALSRNDNLRV